MRFYVFKDHMLVNSYMIYSQDMHSYLEQHVYELGYYFYDRSESGRPGIWKKFSDGAIYEIEESMVPKEYRLLLLLHK